MAEPTSINAHIVESLYCDALLLSDEVRAAFRLPAGEREDGEDADLVRIAMSSEGLRTTTRMMHAIAWLLNLRAYLMGELSETQLRRHSRLGRDLCESDPDQLALLDPRVRALILETQRFYDRLLRLDSNWRQGNPRSPGPVERLRTTLESRTRR
ncbi:MAG: DUF1465 family protein [Novosphingobium sp.]|nr:DUF1465 family protein [Novosphingobium sp.]